MTRVTRTTGPRDGASAERPGRRVRGDATTPETPAPAAERPVRGAAAERPLRGAAAERPARGEAAARPARGAAAAAPAARAAKQAATRRTVAPLPLPRSRDGFLANVCAVMQDLYDVLNEESAAIERRDLTLVGHLQERKEGLSKLYTECIVNLRRDPSLAAGLTDDDRTALKASGEVLRKAVEENMSLLDAGIAVVDNVIRSVVEVARDAGPQDVKLYEARGTLSDGKRRPAMTINKNF